MDENHEVDNNITHLNTGREVIVVAGVGRADGAVGEYSGGQLELLNLRAFLLSSDQSLK